MGEGIIIFSILFSINGARSLGYTYGKENELWFLNNALHRKLLLNVKGKTMKLLEENIREQLHDFGVGKDVLNRTQ